MFSDVVTWGAVALAIGTMIAIVKMSNYYSDRISKAEEKVKSAIEIAKEAKDDAKDSSDKASLLSAAFGLYREQIAKEYIDRDVIREVEDRLKSAIDRMSDRLDRVLESREQPHHPRNPPHRGG